MSSYNAYLFAALTRYVEELEERRPLFNVIERLETATLRRIITQHLRMVRAGERGTLAHLIAELEKRCTAWTGSRASATFYRRQEAFTMAAHLRQTLYHGRA